MSKENPEFIRIDGKIVRDERDRETIDEPHRNKPIINPNDAIPPLHTGRPLNPYNRVLKPSAEED